MGILRSILVNMITLWMVGSVVDIGTTSSVKNDRSNSFEVGYDAYVIANSIQREKLKSFDPFSLDPDFIHCSLDSHSLKFIESIPVCKCTNLSKGGSDSNDHLSGSSNKFFNVHHKRARTKFREMGCFELSITNSFDCLKSMEEIGENSDMIEDADLNYQCNVVDSFDPSSSKMDNQCQECSVVFDFQFEKSMVIDVSMTVDYKLGGNDNKKILDALLSNDRFASCGCLDNASVHDCLHFVDPSSAYESIVDNQIQDCSIIFDCQFEKVMGTDVSMVVDHRVTCNDNKQICDVIVTDDRIDNFM